MFFTHLPDMPEGMSPEQITQANEWLQSNVDTEIWTTAAVCEKYKFSGARLNQLNKAHIIPGHIKFGSTHVYIARFAGPWFDAYRKRADVRKVKVEPKKAGRPKKVKGEYTYTLWGQEYTDTRPPAEVEREWKVKVASYYPHVMQDVENHMVLREAMTYPDQYPDYRDHVRPLFAEIGKLFRKLAAGQE